jgi:hypothetical protein
MIISDYMFRYFLCYRLPLVAIKKIMNSFSNIGEGALEMSICALADGELADSSSGKPVLLTRLTFLNASLLSSELRFHT